MGNTLAIARSRLDAVIAETMASPDEICGLLLSGDAVVLLPCPNVHATPRTHFEIDPRALIAAYRADRQGGPRVIGCYHSHPSGSVLPSATDAAAADTENWVWLIVGDGTAAAWRVVRDGAVQGRFDPVDLVLAPPCA